MSDNRRDVASRNKKVFHYLASRLVACGLTPNHISVMSSIFAALGAWGLWYMAHSKDLCFYIGVALALFGIQMRLICNLIDGLMAVESGLKTPTGELFNDFPDRVSDILFFIGAGLAIHAHFGLWLSFTACILAVLTAYVRVLGASMGAGHFFSGPMAKQHRMFVLNISVIAAIFEWNFNTTIEWSILSGLAVICFGSFLTILNRLQKISAKLNG